MEHFGHGGEMPRYLVVNPTSGQLGSSLRTNVQVRLTALILDDIDSDGDGFWDFR
jgi:hypothetical protein